MRHRTTRSAVRRPSPVAVMVGIPVAFVFIPAQPRAQAGDDQVVPGPDPSGAPPYIEGVRPSDELGGPALVAGRLIDGGGVPASGRVAVIAWSRAAALAALADGDPVKTVVIGQDRAGEDGQFAIKPDPTIDLAEYTEDDGTINLEVRAHGSAGTGLFAFARRLDATGGRWVDAASSPLGDAGRAMPPPEVVVSLDGPATPPLGPSPQTGDKRGPAPITSWPRTRMSSSTLVRPSTAQ